MRLFVLTLALAAAMIRVDGSDAVCPKYVVQDGDTIKTIAKKFQLKTEDIATSMMACGQNAGDLSTGQEICLPGADKPGCMNVKSYNNVLDCKIYQIAKGDTFESIARRLGISKDSLVTLNLKYVRNKGSLQQKQYIKLPVWSEYCDQKEAYGMHNVKKGESISGIASSYGISVDQLLKINPSLDALSILQSNQLVRIPAGSPTCGNGKPCMSSTICKPGSREYLVQEEDDISNIATMFRSTVNEIRRANPGFSKQDGLLPGTLIQIPHSGGCQNSVVMHSKKDKSVSSPAKIRQFRIEPELSFAPETFLPAPELAFTPPAPELAFAPETFLPAPELAFAPETFLPAAEAPAFAQAPQVAPSSTVYGPATQPSFSPEVSPAPIAVPENPPDSSGSITIDSAQAFQYLVAWRNVHGNISECPDMTESSLYLELAAQCFSDESKSDIKFPKYECSPACSEYYAQLGTECLMRMADSETAFATRTLPYLSKNTLPPGNASVLLMETINLMQPGGLKWTVGKFMKDAPRNPEIMSALYTKMSAISEYNKVYYQGIFKDCDLLDVNGIAMASNSFSLNFWATYFILLCTIGQGF